jgi:hypothetical protein
MDYSLYHEFPFPPKLTEPEEKAKEFFLSLPDNEQLSMLNGCCSYKEFRDRVFARMPEQNAAVRA